MQAKISRILLITVIVLLSTVGAPIAHPLAAGTSSPGKPGDGSLTFVENVGQFDERARFQMRGGSATMWLAEDALWLTLVDAPVIETTERPGGQSKVETPRAVNLKLSFVDANPRPHIEPLNRLDSVVHYYRGSDPAQWHTDVPVWGGVRYVDLYPGVDLEVSGEDGRFAWRLVCRADASALRNARLRVEGSEMVTAQDGYLRLTTDVGEIALPLLEVAGDTTNSVAAISISRFFRSTPSAAFNSSTTSADFDDPAAVRATGGAFEVTHPFSAAPLDDPASAQATYPEAAYFGSYLGGSDSDWMYDIAVSGQEDILDRNDDSRAIWVAGWTISSDFPTEPGSTSLSGPSDAFVTKMKRGAVYVAPDFSAYIGGSDEDAAKGIATDADGNAYVTGWTRSGDFPTTANAFDQTHNTCSDCVQCNSESDVFVMKLNDAGTPLYATYLGGSHFYTPGYGNSCGYDRGTAIAVGAQDVVYVTGITRSDNFPTTSGAYDTDFSYEPIGLNEDTFVVKLDLSAGSAGLLYGTFIGGGTPSEGQDIAIDGSGNVYVTGYADGHLGLNYFPTTPGAYITGTDRGTMSEAFILKLNPAGNGSADLLYSTFLGTPTSAESGEGIALDAANHVYIIGSTDNADFPTTAGAFDTTCGTDGTCNGGYSDVFISQLDPAGNGSADLLYSTFLGGMYQDEGQDIALGENGDVYVTGRGVSDGFPITPDAYASNANEFFDAFVTRLRFQGAGADDLVYSTAVGGSGNDEGIAITLDEDNRVYVTGETLSTNFPTTAHALYKTHSGGPTDAFVFRLLAPPQPDLSSSTKTVDPNEATAGQVVTYTVRLANSGAISATAVFTDTLPPSLLLQGSPTASAGGAPGVNGQTITWSGTVNDDASVKITYAALLTSTTTLTPTVFNQAQIDDGVGNVYVRRAFVNGYQIFLPLVIRE